MSLIDDVTNIFKRLVTLENLFHGLLERLDRNGLEGIRKYYGVYRAFVVDNADPQGRGRVRAYSPDVGQTKSSFPDVWIDPVFDGAGAGRGQFWPPEVGDCVRIMFSGGDTGQPCLYLGGWFGAPSGQSEVPSELAHSGSDFPERRGVVTRMGHMLAFDDTKGSEQIQLTWHRSDDGDPAHSDRTKTADRSKGKIATLTFDKDGSIAIVNQNQSKVSLNAKSKSITVVDENKNEILMDSEGVTITDKKGNTVKLAGGKCDVTLSGGFTVTGTEAKLNTETVSLGSGAAFKSVLGEILDVYLKTHTHPTGVGPSGPPIAPPPPSMYSSSVKLKK